MAYDDANLSDFERYAASYVDKILRRVAVGPYGVELGRLGGNLKCVRSRVGR